MLEYRHLTNQMVAHTRAGEVLTHRLLSAHPRQWPLFVRRQMTSIRAATGGAALRLLDFGWRSGVLIRTRLVRFEPSHQTWIARFGAVRHA